MRSILADHLTSFAVMREQRVDTSFTFDGHFAEQGFSVAPASAGNR